MNCIPQEVSALYDDLYTHRIHDWLNEIDIKMKYFGNTKTHKKETPNSLPFPIR